MADALRMKLPNAAPNVQREPTPTLATDLARQVVCCGSVTFVRARYACVLERARVYGVLIFVCARTQTGAAHGRHRRTAGGVPVIVSRDRTTKHAADADNGS